MFKEESVKRRRLQLPVPKQIYKQVDGGCEDGVGRQGDHAARSLDEDGIIGIHHEGGHLEEFVQGSFKSRR